ncbi:hypothetical protein FRC07_010423, partial [Ceratobasidium sp. 392]
WNCWRCGNGCVPQVPTPGIQRKPLRESVAKLPNTHAEMAKEIWEWTAKLLDIMNVVVWVVTNLRTRCIAIGERIEVETSQLTNCISCLTPVKLVRHFWEENNAGPAPEMISADSSTGTISISRNTDVPLSAEEVLSALMT